MNIETNTICYLCLYEKPSKNRTHPTIFWVRQCNSLTIIHAEAPNLNSILLYSKLNLIQDQIYRAPSENRKYYSVAMSIQTSSLTIILHRCAQMKKSINKPFMHMIWYSVATSFFCHSIIYLNCNILYVFNDYLTSKPFSVMIPNVGRIHHPPVVQDNILVGHA